MEDRFEPTYAQIGRIVTTAAFAERSIIGLRARLLGGLAAHWDRAEREQVSANIDACIKLLREFTPQSDSTDDLVKHLAHLRALFDIRNHLVHGLPNPPASGDQPSLWRKHVRQGGNHWTEESLDHEALRLFAAKLGVAWSHLGQLEDEILPREIVSTIEDSDGSIDRSIIVYPSRPRNPRSSASPR